MYEEVRAKEVARKQQAQDMSEVTKYDNIFFHNGLEHMILTC